MLVILGVGWATPACQCQECESSKRSSSSFSSRFKYWPRLERICLLFHQTCVGVGARFCSTLGLLGSWSFKQNSAEADLVRSCERGWQMSQLFEQKWCHLPFSFSTPLRFFYFKKIFLSEWNFYSSVSGLVVQAAWNFSSRSYGRTLLEVSRTHFAILHNVGIFSSPTRR